MTASIFPHDLSLLYFICVTQRQDFLFYEFLLFFSVWILEVLVFGSQRWESHQLGMLFKIYFFWKFFTNLCVLHHYYWGEMQSFFFRLISIYINASSLSMYVILATDFFYLCFSFIILPFKELIHIIMCGIID